MCKLAAVDSKGTQGCLCAFCSACRGMLSGWTCVPCIYAPFIKAADRPTMLLCFARWMAPEVIEHKPYDGKADVFSFGVVLWELLTCRVPYSEMTPLQVEGHVQQQRRVLQQAYGGP